MRTYFVALIVSLQLFGCGESFKDEKFEVDNEVVTLAEPIEIVETIKYDLDLKDNFTIASDIVEFNDGVLVYTNGYKLTINSRKIIFNNNVFKSYKSYSSGCDKNGATANDIYLNADVLTGDAEFSLRGKNAGNHCKVYWSIGTRWCLRFKESHSDYAKACYEHYKKLNGFSGGNAGRIVYNVEANVDEFNTTIYNEHSVGTPATKLRYIHDKRTAPKGKNGTRTKICTDFNGVTLCE